MDSVVEKELQIAHLDAAVEEVFRLMMGVPCTPVQSPATENGAAVTAVVGLAGALSGVCVLRAGEGVAVAMAAALMGMEMDAIDDTVKDAVGEVCNMLAGAWKGKLPHLAADCMLSVPAVVSGTDYRLHMQRPEFRIDRSYRFGERVLDFSIVCESAQ